MNAWDMNTQLVATLEPCDTQQQDHIEALKQDSDLLGQCLLYSLKAIKIRDEEDESISFLNDTLEIKKYEGKGFAVNLPKIIRMLGGTIGGEQEE